MIAVHSWRDLQTLRQCRFLGFYEVCGWWPTQTSIALQTIVHAPTTHDFCIKESILCSCHRQTVKACQHVLNGNAILGILGRLARRKWLLNSSKGMLHNVCITCRALSDDHSNMHLIGVSYTFGCPIPWQSFGSTSLFLPEATDGGSCCLFLDGTAQNYVTIESQWGLWCTYDNINQIQTPSKVLVLK